MRPRPPPLNLIWLSDAAFQLAGGLGLVALLLSAASERRPRWWSAAVSLLGVVALLSASGLVLALAAVRLHRPRVEFPN